MSHRTVLTGAAAGLLIAAALSGCESNGQPSRYQQDLQRLRETCEQRGGLLQPSGANTGQPQVDNACIIRGPATPLRND